MKPPSSPRRLVLALCAMACMPHRSWSATGDASRGLAIIYPDIGRDGLGTEGIEDQVHARLPAYPVSASVNVADLASELRKQDIRVVIALGRNGLKAASAIDQISIVAGGVLSVPESDAKRFTVHSLAPDPALLFEGKLRPAGVKVSGILKDFRLR